MIINGALECSSWTQQAQNRATYYTNYAAKLGVDITGEKLTCSDMAQFSSSGSAGQLKLYWAPESSCSLVTWQTAYSALIEGDHAKCQGLTPSCGSETTTEGSATTSVTSETTTNSGTESTTECEATEPLKVICYYPNWPYYRNGKKDCNIVCLLFMIYKYGRKWKIPSGRH